MYNNFEYAPGVISNPEIIKINDFERNRFVGIQDSVWIH